MSRLNNVSKRLDRAIHLAIGQHQGPKLWLLSAFQRRDYERFRAAGKEQIGEHEAEYGPGSYYAGYLNGSLKCSPLPDHLKRALRIPDAPHIPLGATLGQARRIYESYLLEPD